MFELDIITENNLRARIVAQEDAENPRRDQDHAATLWIRHPRYDLGDDNDITQDMNEFLSEVSQHLGGSDLTRALVKHAVRAHGATVALPLYLHDHSGLSIGAGADLAADADMPDTTRVGWDTSFVGFAFDTAAGRTAFGLGDTSDAARLVDSEVVELDEYLTGQVYGVIIESRVSTKTTVTDHTGTLLRTTEDEDWDEVDAIWGLYGDDYAREEAKSMLAERA